MEFYNSKGNIKKYAVKDTVSLSFWAINTIYSLLLMEFQNLPDEDLKALLFAKKSILRKNLMIINLQKREKELHAEVESWKKKYLEKEALLERLSPQLIEEENFVEPNIEAKDFSSTQEKNPIPYDVPIKEEECENFGAEPYDGSSHPVSSSGGKRMRAESSLEPQPGHSTKSRAEVADSFPTEPSFHDPFDDYGSENADFDTATNLGQAPEQESFPPTSRYPGADTFRLSSADATYVASGAFPRSWDPGTFEAGTFRLAPESSWHRHCAICAMEFDTREELETHVRTHTDPEAYECPVEGCGYRTKFATHLAAHRRTHLTGERSFACTVEGCDYRTGSSQHMTLHQRTHTGEKPFACPEEGCGFRARHKGHLSAHRRVHTGERPFACPAEGCGYRTTQSGTLRNHMRTHTGERPFACSAEGCGFRSARRADLTSHILKRHHKTL